VTPRARLDSLLHAYVAERADDTQTVTSVFALLTTTIGLFTVIGFALTHASSLPAWAIALTPLPPIPFIAFGALVAHIAQIRGRIIDEYESEIRALTRELDDDDAALAPYGHTLLDSRVWQSYYSRVVVGVSFVTLFPLYVAVLVQAYRESYREEFALALTSLAGCSIVTAILIALFVIALNPRREFERGLAQLRGVGTGLGSELPGQHRSG
jgi:hypothetical protein